MHRYFVRNLWDPHNHSRTFEPRHDNGNKMACATSEDSDKPGHPPSPIRVFAVRMKKAWVLSYPLSAQRRLCSDWADAQADLSLCWAHTHFVGFVMSWLIYFIYFIVYYDAVQRYTCILKFKWQRFIFLFLYYSFNGIISRIIPQKTACKKSN